MKRLATWGAAGAFVLWTVVLGLVGASLLWTTFMLYDDEGYVLWSLQTFAERGGLYDDVYTQYGPFFFILYRGLHTLGLEFSNTSARALTLFYWLGASGCCAALTWRTTRSTVAAALAMTGVFLHLWQLTHEPSHPGGLIVFAVALCAWLGRHHPTVLGMAAAALILTKINVGVFLIAGVAAWRLIHTSENHRWNRWIAGGALVLLPVALMRNLLHEAAFATFATIVAAGSASVVIAAKPMRPNAAPQHYIGSACAMCFGAIIVVAAATLLFGTSLRGLAEGIVIGPLKHPVTYSMGFTWQAGSLPIAAGGLLIAMLLAIRSPERRSSLVIMGRVIAAAAFAVCHLDLVAMDFHAFALSFGIGTAWIFVMPCRPDDSTADTRTWTGLLLVTQALHAYPVAGSQISWGTFLWWPLILMGLHDGLQTLNRPRLATILAAGVVALLGWFTLRDATIGSARFRNSDALRLPGAEHIHLPEHFSSALRILASNTALHADMLFTLPGLHSFHLWTNVPPPTHANATHWFNLLSAAEQERIRARLEQTPRSAIIVQRTVLDFLSHQGVPTDSPLAHWLRSHYEPAFKLETYEFWIPKGRSIAPIGTARIFEAASPKLPRYKIEITLGHSSARQITTIDLRQFERDLSRSFTAWSNANARLVLTPLATNGEPRGSPTEQSLPLTVQGLYRLDVYTDDFPDQFASHRGIIHLIGPNGERVGEARVID